MEQKLSRVVAEQSSVKPEKKSAQADVDERLTTDLPEKRKVPPLPAGTNVPDWRTAAPREADGAPVVQSRSRKSPAHMPGRRGIATKPPAPDTPDGGALQSLRETIRSFPELVISAGLLVAALLILALAMARAAISRARQLESMYKKVESEVNERRLAEEQVKSLNADLEQRVSELGQLNSQLKTARDQALDASRLKSEFVANISHEIRTPISGVIGMNQLLLSSALQPKEREYARLVNESAQSLLGVINDILDFSKIEAGMIELNTAPFSAAGLLREVSDVVSAAVRQKGLFLLTACAPDLPVSLTGDTARLRQVLVNLAGNAIKFTKTGEVVIQAQRVADHPEMVRFSVVDTGIGIPVAAQSKLFQPFVQADGSTTRQFGGTGLGLSISKRLVELMGGRISLESAENAGAKFHFDVPLLAPLLKDHPPEGTVLEVVSPGFAGRERIVLCSGNQLSRSVLSQSLTEAGFVVSECDQSGLVAELASPHKTDLVVVDAVSCPGAAATINRSDGTTRVPVIGMFSDPDDGESLSNYHARLTVPVNTEELVRWVTSVLKQESFAAGDNDVNTATCATPLPAVSNARVLVAEDSLVLQQMLEILFERVGCATDIVGNGREAVEAASKGAYDLIFMDWQMPEMDGLSATRCIRDRESGGKLHTPIVAMTANAMQGDRDACLAAGMDDYISKPFTFEELRTMVEKWIPDFRTEGSRPAHEE